jgi:hypothetical protein
MNITPPENSPYAEIREWSGEYIIGKRYALGLAGRHNRGARGGGKIHIVEVNEVIAIVPPHLPGRGTVGAKFMQQGYPAHFGTSPACGTTQGQWAGRELPKSGNYAVTCAKCAKFPIENFIKA